MKSNRNKFLAVVLSALLLLGSLPLTVFGAETVDSGKCGENVTWTLDSDGVLTIGGEGDMYSFEGDPSPFYKNREILSIIIGTGVTSIGAWAFSGCAGLTSVTIPDSVTSIGSDAFHGCAGLKSVTIPDSVTSIGHFAFYGCAGLTSVTIPDCVTSIERNAFSGCTNLTELAVDAGNPVYFSAGNCIIEKESKTLVVGCSNSAIPDDGSVTSIGFFAFDVCVGLTSVTIPDSVTSIGDQAFSGCAGLTALAVDANNPVYFSAGNCIIEKESKTLVVGCRNSAIPDDGSVTSIGTEAFSGCAGLTSIAIPDSVTSIGDQAFHGCTSLTSVTIPVSVTSIGSSAFSDCTGLTSVTIPDSVTSIGDYAFSDCTGLTSVTIPDSVTSIGSSAFSGCAGLTSVTIPTGVTSIGQYAFDGCTGLTSVTIPDSVTSIEYGAFYGCTGLTSVTIPISVTEIGGEAIPASTVIYGSVGSYAQQWAEENDRAFLPIGDAAVTLTAPETVNEPVVNVCGFANPGAEVVCSVNGEETVRVTASASGRWNATIPLNGAKDGDSVTVEAAVTVDGKTAKQAAAVTYSPDAVVFQEFTLTHRCYSVTVKGERLGVSLPNVTYVPGYPLAFKIRVTNDERIDKLYVVSTKDGGSKQMELTYNEETGDWLAAGFFDETDKNYVPGVFSVRGVDKDGGEFDMGMTIRIRFLIDPSGYAYEAVKSDWLAGVTAAVYYKDAQGHELLWNAEPADQLNPVTTLADGAFAWVVPEGQWQVRLTKEGYEEARSEWMDVPPEYTDVYLGMTSTAAPEVAYCGVSADRAEIVFSQYMRIDSVNAETVKIGGCAGVIAPLDQTETEEGSGVFYAKSFVFTPEKAFAGDVAVTVENAVNYAGAAMSAPFTATLPVAAGPKDLTVPQNVSVGYGKTAEIEIRAENAAGMTVSVACDSANVTLSADPLTLDADGRATLEVTGDMPGVAELTFTLNGATLTATAKVAVEAPGVPAAEPLTDEPATTRPPETEQTEPGTTAPAGEGFTLGDVNMDGKINSSDARLALRAAAKTEKLSELQTRLADVSEDGKVKAADARTILRIAAKLEPRPTKTIA